MKKGVLLTFIILFLGLDYAYSQGTTLYYKNPRDSVCEKELPSALTDSIAKRKELLLEKSIRKPGFFGNILSFFGLREKKSELTDSVPTSWDMFSFDKVEDSGKFIFTKEQEKAYLDSLKMALIHKRREIARKKNLLSMPLDKMKITSNYGYRSDPFTGERKFHNGIDFRAHNDFVYSIMPGVVIRSGKRGGYGFCVEIRHGEISSLYAHLSYCLVDVGQTVSAGYPIGISGTSGRSTGEHLHFSVFMNGKCTDPTPVLSYIASTLSDRTGEMMSEIREKSDELKRQVSSLKKEKELLMQLDKSESRVQPPSQRKAPVFSSGTLKYGKADSTQTVKKAVIRYGVRVNEITKKDSVQSPKSTMDVIKKGNSLIVVSKKDNKKQ